MLAMSWMYVFIFSLFLSASTSTQQNPFSSSSHQDNEQTMANVSVFRQLSKIKASRTAMEYPDFFVIGAMKCATSSLNALIITHPEICSEGDKEKHFFDTDAFLDKKGYESYLKEFKNCKNLYTIDSTPRYIQEELVPGRLVESYSPTDLAGKRFILSLREPTARLYSEYQDMVRICLEHGGITGYRDNEKKKDTAFQLSRGALKCPFVSKNYRPNGMAFEDLELLTFEEWVASEYGQTEISRGYYRQHIQKWVSAGISRSQILVLNFQTLTRNTTDSMKRISAFLGLKSDWGESVSLPESKQTKPNTVMDCKTFQQLDQHYGPMNSNLYTYINNGVNKPKQEPYFPIFESSKSKCVGVLMPTATATTS